MTLNGVMAVTLRYFNEFGKRTFQLITASSSIKLIDQESTSISLYRAVKLVCVTKFTQSRADNACKSVDAYYLRLIYRLSFTLPLHLTLDFRLMFMGSHCNYAVFCSFGRAQCFVVHVRCRRKESSRSLSHLRMSFLSHLLTAGVGRPQRSAAVSRQQRDKLDQNSSSRLHAAAQTDRWLERHPDQPR